MDYSLEDIYDGVKAIVDHFYAGFTVELTDTEINVFDHQYSRVGFVDKTYQVYIEVGGQKIRFPLECYISSINDGDSPNAYPFIIFLLNIITTYNVGVSMCTRTITLRGVSRRYKWSWDSAWCISATIRRADATPSVIELNQECLKWNKSAERMQMLEVLTKESTEKKLQPDIAPDVQTTTTVQSELEATIITMLRKIPTAPYDEQKNCVTIVKELMTLINK